MTNTISASPQTLADSLPQLTKHGPIYRHNALFHPLSLQHPSQLPPSLAKRRTKADRCLLLELDHTHSNSKRRSSHKAMGKRIFFLLSGHQHMPKTGPLSPYELVSAFGQKVSPKLKNRLPSFREGFPYWGQDASHTDPPMQIEDHLDGGTFNEKRDTRVHLPGVWSLLRGL